MGVRDIANEQSSAHAFVKGEVQNYNGSARLALLGRKGCTWSSGAMGCSILGKPNDN